MKLPVYPEEVLKQDKEYCLKKLGLSDKEFEEIMSEPIKSSKDYPSNQWVFERLSFLVNKAKQIGKLE